ncbi:MAG: hypothetical protein J2P45_12870 [Candidatus Dormibacteraeota bacterium]|nr:hypothetical protein [Candidatus Dormibacteraeota bacterium]
MDNYRHEVEKLVLDAYALDAIAARTRSLAVVPKEARTSIQEAGHAWLAHLCTEGRSVKTLYDRERNLLANVGESQPQFDPIKALRLLTARCWSSPPAG